MPFPKPPLVPVLLVACAAAGPAAPAAAQESDSDALARDHFVVGRRYFEQARYAEAAREFQEAFRLSGRIELLLNLALAQERALEYGSAIASLERYLEASPPNADDRADVENRIERLRALEASEDARVRERAAALAAERGPGDPSPGGSTEGGGGPSRLQWVGIGLLAGGAAIGGAAIGTGVAASSIHDDLESVQDPDGSVPADRADDIDRGRALANTSTVLTFVAAAAGIAGVVLLIVGADADDDAASDEASGHFRFRFGASPQGAFAGAEMAF